MERNGTLKEEIVPLVLSSAVGVSFPPRCSGESIAPPQSHLGDNERATAAAAVGRIEEEGRKERSHRSHRTDCTAKKEGRKKKLNCAAEKRAARPAAGAEGAAELAS